MGFPYSFLLVCSIAVAISVIAVLSYGAYRIYGAPTVIARTKRLERTQAWILSLDKALLLALLIQPNTGLDKQDLDGLVQLAFDSYPEGQKDVIVARLADHLN